LAIRGPQPASERASSRGAQGVRLASARGRPRDHLPGVLIAGKKRQGSGGTLARIKKRRGDRRPDKLAKGERGKKKKIEKRDPERTEPFSTLKTNRKKRSKQEILILPGRKVLTERTSSSSREKGCMCFRKDPASPNPLEEKD